MSACFSCGNDHGNPHDLAVDILSLTAERDEAIVNLGLSMYENASLRAERVREIGPFDAWTLVAALRERTASLETEREATLETVQRVFDEWFNEETEQGTPLSFLGDLLGSLSSETGEAP